VKLSHSALVGHFSVVVREPR